MDKIDQFYDACENEDEDAVIDWIAENIKPSNIQEFIKELDMDPTTIYEGFESYPSTLEACFHDGNDMRVTEKHSHKFTQCQTFALAICFLDNRVSGF